MGIKWIFLGWILLAPRIRRCSSLQANYNTTIYVYDGDYYKGKEVKFANMNKKPVPIPKLGNGMSSFKIDWGSCLELHKKYPPSYASYEDWKYATGYHHNYANDHREDFDNKVLALAPCPIETQAFTCPEDYFVEKLFWDSHQKLQTGIEIHCISAKSKKDTLVMRTHGTGRLRHRSYCPKSILRGINQLKNGRKEVVIALLHQGCTPDPKRYQVFEKNKLDEESVKYDHFGYMSQCPKGEALVGLKVDIEKHSNHVKYVTVICRPVKTAAEYCVPRDKVEVLITCDGLNASHSFTCTHTMTSGSQHKKSVSEEFSLAAGIELEFHGEAGPTDMGRKIKGEIGLSLNTGVNWKKASDKLFSGSSTSETGIPVLPGCISSITQVVAECGYYEVRLNEYSRKDFCPNGPKKAATG